MGKYYHNWILQWKFTMYIIIFFNFLNFTHYITHDVILFRLFLIKNCNWFFVWKKSYLLTSTVDRLPKPNSFIPGKFHVMYTASNHYQLTVILFTFYNIFLSLPWHKGPSETMSTTAYYNILSFMQSTRRRSSKLVSCAFSPWVENNSTQVFVLNISDDIGIHVISYLNTWTKYLVMC